MPKTAKSKRPKRKRATTRRAAGKSLIQKTLGPAAENLGKEIAVLGTEAGPVMLTVGRLLISGLEKTVFGLRHVGQWVREAVSQRLEKVAPEKIVEPNPRIAVPATQSLIYSMNDELIREMFANLLAADMNADTKALAHPAFVEMIREMTPIDARVLSLLSRQDQADFSGRIVFAGGTKWQEVARQLSFELDGIDDETARRSVRNLIRLGIVESQPDAYPSRPDIDRIENGLKDRVQQFVATLAQSPELQERRGLSGPLEATVGPYGLFVTPFGRAFVKICLSN